MAHRRFNLLIKLILNFPISRRLFRRLWPLSFAAHRWLLLESFPCRLLSFFDRLKDSFLLFALCLGVVFPSLAGLLRISLLGREICLNNRVRTGSLRRFDYVFLCFGTWDNQGFAELRCHFVLNEWFLCSFLLFLHIILVVETVNECVR